MMRILSICVVVGCTSRLINLAPDVDPREQNRELARILASSLQSLVILDEDVPRFLDALEDPSSPRLRQVAVRLLSLKPQLNIYRAITQRLTDTDADVRREALYALLRADAEYGEVLFEAIVKPGVYQADRQALAGRISQFGKEGKVLLIRMLAENDLLVARIAARNLKRLYPNYPNALLTDLINQNTETSTFSASAWLASYSDEDAVRQQLSYSISPYSHVRERANLLYMEAGDWILPVTQNLLKNDIPAQPSIRVLMIQKLIDRNNEAALPYLLEFFSYDTDARAQQQTMQYVNSYRTLAFEILREGFSSLNLQVREKSLYFAQGMIDKKTLLAVIPLLNTDNKKIYQLARSYVEKGVKNFVPDLASQFNPERGLNSDTTIFQILLAAGRPELLWFPYQKKTDSLRLFYLFQKVSNTNMQDYFKKLQDPIYILQLNLIYQVYQLGLQFRRDNTTYANSTIIHQTQLVARAGLQQENNSENSQENFLISELRNWYKIIKGSSPEELSKLAKYRTQATTIYENYLGIQPDFRQIAQDILSRIGLSTEYLRAVSTYVPKA